MSTPPLELMIKPLVLTLFAPLVFYFCRCHFAYIPLDCVCALLLAPHMLPNNLRQVRGPRAFQSFPLVPSNLPLALVFAASCPLDARGGEFFIVSVGSWQTTFLYIWVLCFPLMWCAEYNVKQLVPARNVSHERCTPDMHNFLGVPWVNSDGNSKGVRPKFTEFARMP